MDEHWETLTFGDLVPGDVVRLDEEGPEETVRTFGVLLRTDQNVYLRPDSTPVLVRFPRPEVGA